VIINHNISALNTYRNLTSVNNALQKSLERLSSGLRINRAADDAAGLAISEKMRGQIRGLAQAIRNAQDAISLIQTAEGGLNETHSILQRMRELAVQAASETTTDTDRAEIQKEINQLISELNRIANSTEFNTKKLLNGQAGAVASPQNGVAGVSGTNTIKVGAGTYSTSNTNVSSTDLQAAVSVTAGVDTKAGVYQVVVQQNATSAKISAVALSSSPAAGTLTINGYSVTIASGDTFATVKTKINNITGQTGVEATYTAPTVGLATNNIATAITAYQGLDPTAKYQLKYDSNAKTLALQKSTDGGTTYTDVGNTVNVSTWPSSQTITLGSAEESVTVTLAASAPGTDATDAINITAGGLTLTTVNSGSAATINVSGSNALLRSLGLVAASDTSTSVLSAAGTDAQGTIDGRTAVGVGNTLTLNDNTSGANGLTVKLLNVNLDADGDGIWGTLSFDAAVDVTGRVTLQIGANNSEEQRLDLDIGDMRATALGVDTISVLTAADALRAVTNIDAAISTVSSERAKLGAYQNRLEHTINNLSVAKENLTAAESRIRDLDMAEEMMVFTRNQIISQAATAMLAQANQVPAIVLQLLR